MSYASIMVHVDRIADTVPRIKLAADLADRFGARLTGIAARSVTLTPFAAENVLDEFAVARVAVEANALIREVEATFKETVGQRRAVKFRSDLQDPVHFVIEQSRCADLITVGRRGGTDAFDGRFGVDPGQLVLALGRPMLVVPPGVAHLRAEHVVVAWKNTREARRAVLDSLPLLQRASDVTVASVVEDESEQGTGDVVELLQCHGVAAEMHRSLFPERQAADEIYELLQARQADLLVAGAYGYGRFREWIFGGTTRDFLRTSPVCCLMSH